MSALFRYINLGDHFAVGISKLGFPTWDSVARRRLLNVSRPRNGAIPVRLKGQVRI